MNGPGPAVDLPAHRFQEGIYFIPGKRPGHSYRLLLLNFRPGITGLEARQALATVWTMLQELRRGALRDLRPTRPTDPEITFPPADLTCLLGFGARLFDRQSHTPPLVSSEQDTMPRDTTTRPELGMLKQIGPEAPFPSLPWIAVEDRRIGEADVAIQFIAETELAVNQAVVEVSKVLGDERLPLEIVRFYSGFNRDDRRSWIGFYDGISNIAPNQRIAAIEVVRKNPMWIERGTYMAFLRLAIDLSQWRSLSREQQEILVGRDKLTGCPLERVTAGSAEGFVPVPAAGCPLSNTPPTRAVDIDPARRSDRLLQASHIHRANRDRDNGSKDGSNRIFRQGYEFLEALPDGRLQVGLNFVSFQRSLLRLKRVLTFTGWLKDVNFGGPTDNPPPGLPASRFLSVIAGGYYAIPPRGEPFPGAELF